MNLYKKLVPEIIRTQIRNPQYIFHDIKFLFRYLQSRVPVIQSTRAPVIPKSICYIIPTTNITGGVAVVCEHLNRLQKLGFNCLIASYDNKTDLSWFPQSVKVVPLKGNKELIEKYHTVVATGWITAYELLLLNVKRKMYLVQSDETKFYPKGSYLKTRVRRTYKFLFEFITIAKWLQKFLKDNFNQESFYVPNGINTDIFHPVTPLSPKLKNKTRILLEGAINLPFKGMQKAFEVIKDIDCEVWCVSYDGKPQPNWRCDRFFEKVPMIDMPKIYSSCDILLKLSLVESFGYPPLEMMACGGVPVVSDIVGHHEYMVDKLNVLFTDPKNIKKTKTILQNLIKNKSLYQKLQSNSQKTVNQFKWENSIKKLKTIFS